ncbi:Linearmycin resistance ATP-binding protein LnrL [Candidatus Magnetaquicoccaceae bacterium FCR-1]|uniref:Linearmycin resistance ATP-binding protein LnrL n=1 Tax=Candidatus Magnetaquiglobus chichijimensis TaxID=3141448 RepID=A0ABQ0C723_9PROT
MTPPDSPAVRIAGLTHAYPGRRRQPPRLALDGLDLTIPRGCFFVLTGPNGSGKSTLFKILSGLLLPSEGSIRILDHDLIAHPHAARRGMGVVFQRPALDKHMTVLENLKIHADLHDLPNDLFQARLEAALTWGDLGGRLNDRVATLSGGLARQAELIKVLLHDPALLILDEPTVGLDPGGRSAFLATLRRLKNRHGVTILMTSHIFAEAEQADQVGILRHGRLLALDTPRDLTRRLGEELLVIDCDEPEQLAAGLNDHPGLKTQIQNHELRIQGAELPVIMDTLLKHHREKIHTLALKQPSLEDLYIHLTGRALARDEEENP